jgi:hypothetical protein
VDYCPDAQLVRSNSIKHSRKRNRFHVYARSRTSTPYNVRYPFQNLRADAAVTSQIQVPLKCFFRKLMKGDLFLQEFPTSCAVLRPNNFSVTLRREHLPRLELTRSVLDREPCRTPLLRLDSGEPSPACRIDLKCRSHPGPPKSPPHSNCVFHSAFSKSFVKHLHGVIVMHPWKSEGQFLQALPYRVYKDLQFLLAIFQELEAANVRKKTFPTDP